MLIHPPLQLFLNGHTQLSDVPVGLPADGSKPCGAVLLDEQVIQYLLLLIAEGEEELGEKPVCCQLVQLIGTGEDDVEKVSLTELTEPWQDVYKRQATRKIRLTGTTANMAKSGGMNGRSSKTAIWKPTTARNEMCIRDSGNVPELP